MAVRDVDSVEAARALARELNDSSRGRVVVVITVPAGASRPLIDRDEVAEAVGDLADVYVLPNGDPSWAFADDMPPGTQAYGGAGRVYPLGLEWVENLRRSPLRFVWSPSEAPAATALLISDALSAAAAAGLTFARAVGPSTVVSAVVGSTPTVSQAIVRLDDGDFGVVRTGAIFPGISAERLFVAGMRLQGDWYAADRTLDLSRHLPDPLSRLSDVTVDALIPVLVQDVDESSCELVVVPGLTCRLAAAEVTGDPDDDLRDLLSEGEVVVGRFTGDVDRPIALLGLAEEATPQPALSLSRGAALAGRRAGTRTRTRAGTGPAGTGGRRPDGRGRARHPRNARGCAGPSGSLGRSASTQPAAP